MIAIATKKKAKFKKLKHQENNFVPSKNLSFPKFDIMKLKMNLFECIVNKLC